MSSTQRLPRRARVAALLVLAPLALGAACSDSDGVQGAAAAAAAGPGLVFIEPQFPQAPDEVDLGHVRFGEIAERTVKLRNTSSAPVTVRSIRAGCSCTTPRLSYVDPRSGERVRGNAGASGDVLTLPPGVEADLDLRVDTTIAPAKNKPKNVIVRITTDSLETPYLTLNVYMFVESFFRPSPAVIELRQVAQNGGGEGEVAIALDNEEGRFLTEVLSSPLELLPDLQLQHVQGSRLWTLNVRLLPPVAPGPHEYDVLLGTTGPDGEGEGEPLLVRVRAMGVPDVMIEPDKIVLGRPAPGEFPRGEARLVTRLPGHTLRVERARVEGPTADALHVELIAEAPDEDGRSPAWRVSLVASEALEPTSQQGTLVLETDDEQFPRLEARWFYRP